MNKILFIANSVEGTMKQRVVMPAKYLPADIAIETNIMTLECKIMVNILGTMKPIIRPFYYYDVVILQYATDPDLIFLIKKLNKLGIKTVIDTDDDLVNSNPFYPIKKETTKAIIEAIQSVSLVTVTTESLADTYSKYNSNIKIIPNCIDISEYPIKKNYGITVGWYSSGIRFEEMRKILEGWIPDNIWLYLAGAEVFKHFKHKYLLWVDRFNPTDTPKILSNIDIGLIPLSLCKFNNGKSDLKGLEYGAMNIPAIASPTVPYKKLINHGVNGYLVKHGRDWTKYINLLINDNELRINMGNEARKVSESRDIKLSINNWKEAYNY